MSEVFWIWLEVAVLAFLKIEFESVSTLPNNYFIGRLFFYIEPYREKWCTYDFSDGGPNEQKYVIEDALFYTSVVFFVELESETIYVPSKLVDLNS